MTTARFCAIRWRAPFVSGATVLALAGLASAYPGPTIVRLGRTSFGQGLVADTLQNGQRYAIYISTHDRRDKSRCFGRCSRRFKPVMTHGRPQVGVGVRQKLLGIIDRGHGFKQVTYNHHPLYTSADDSSPGVAVDDGCRIAGGRWGRWFVIRRNGSPDKRLSCPGY